MYKKCYVPDTPVCILLDLPNEMAWGSKKKIFYDSDYVTKSKHRCKHVLMYDIILYMLHLYKIYIYIYILVCTFYKVCLV